MTATRLSVIPESLTQEEHENQQTIEQETAVQAGGAKEKQGKVLHGFKAYSPSLHPMLDPKNASQENPVQVRFLVGSEVTFPSTFLVEGVERSLYMKLISVSHYDSWKFSMLDTNKFEFGQPVVWMADMESMGLNCHILHSLVMHVQGKSKEKIPDALVLMDYSGSAERLHCPDVESIIPRGRIRLTRSNIIQNRYWNPSESWIDVGALSPNDGNRVSGGPILFQPHVVTESFVSALSQALQSANFTNSDDSDKRSPVDYKRKKDLAHFWNVSDYSHYSFLRRQVSTIVTSLSGKRARGREIHTIVDVMGDVEKMEFNEIQSQYVEQLINVKVVVVAQRDEWEGHYRLLEALASGAMVFADKALALPDGLEHKKSVILYDSAKSLEDSLLYYLRPNLDKVRLSIARKGWQVAMGRHRSWHRVEEVLYGKPLTQVDRPLDPAPPRKREYLQSDDILGIAMTVER